MAWILFVVIPFSAAIAAPLWFRHLPFVSKVRKRAPELDKSIIQLPSAPVTLNQLRNYENCGDKTVVVHHLTKLVREAERGIVNGFLETTVLSLLVVVFLVVAQTPQRAQVPSRTSKVSEAQSSEAQEPPRESDKARGILADIRDVGEQIPLFYALPTTMFILILKSLLLAFTLRDQVYEYDEVLRN